MNMISETCMRTYTRDHEAKFCVNGHGNPDLHIPLRHVTYLIECPQEKNKNTTDIPQDISNEHKERPETGANTLH